MDAPPSPPLACPLPAPAPAAVVAGLQALYGIRLLRAMRRYVQGNDEDVEDVVQDAFTGALRSLPSYRRESTLYTWLHGVAQNKAADFRRHAFRHQHARHRLLEQQLREPVIQVTLEDMVLEGEERERVRRVLARLPEHYQAVLCYKYVEGRQVDDIARVMGRTFKSAESLLTRARVAFREAWGDGG